LKKSDEIEIKTFNLVFSFIESILARFRTKEVKNPTTYLAGELNTSKAYISKIFSGEGNFTVKTLISIANAADLEVELLLRDRTSSKVFDYMQIATVDTETQSASIDKSYTPYFVMLLPTHNTNFNRRVPVSKQKYKLTVPAHSGKSILSNEVLV